VGGRGETPFKKTTRPTPHALDQAATRASTTVKTKGKAQSARSVGQKADVPGRQHGDGDAQVAVIR